MKETKRKAFNFFRSYYDVYNELNDKEKVQFMDALLDRQFLGTKPTDLKGMAKFAYISQTNSIDSQVKGYEDKTGVVLFDSSKLEGGSVGGNDGGSVPPTVQVQEKGKEEGKGKEEVQVVIVADALLFIEKVNQDKKEIFSTWIQYRIEIKKAIKSEITLNSLIKKINSEPLEKCTLVINASIENQWTGLFWDKVVAKRPNTIEQAGKNALDAQEILRQRELNR